MSDKVKIYSTLKLGEVVFDGAKVSNKETKTLTVNAHPTLVNRIQIKSNYEFKKNSSTKYRVFFRKLHIDRIQNEAGQNLVNDLGMDIYAVIAYVLDQINKPTVTEFFEYNSSSERLKADLDIVSPYIDYQAMDFGLDAIGSTILLRDLSLGNNSLLIPEHVNTLEAIAEGTGIKIKAKGGARVVVESLPVSGVSINGSYVNSVLNLAVVQLNNVFSNTVGLTSSGGNPVANVVVFEDNLTIILEDGTSFTNELTNLGVHTDKFVESGVASGTNIILTMDDGTPIIIDAQNMINGSSSLASNSGWNISYGANANSPVGASTNDSTVNQQLPFYFGKLLERGSEFKWNFQSHGGFNLILGIWDGAEVATAYDGGSATASNWGTMFNYEDGFTDGSNSVLFNSNKVEADGTPKYEVTNGSALGIRFGNDGHLTLIDYSDGNEITIAKTVISLAVTSFSMQIHTLNNGVLPNGIINNVDYIWDIVHDRDNIENGIIDGIKNHTVLKSVISIEAGEKIMFFLDDDGKGDFFGTNYTGASSGVSDAEETLSNSFVYGSQENIILNSSAGVSDWDFNSSSSYGYTIDGINYYREFTQGTLQGQFSIRFTINGDIELWSEEADERVATAKAVPAVGSSIHLYYGVKGNRSFSFIPIISKQAIRQGNQPDANFVPTVADQTVSVIEGDVLNFQIVSSDNIVNQFVALDAPSWMFTEDISLRSFQSTGIITGTAPAYLGTNDDNIIINCKAGNSFGGAVNFSLTVTVLEDTSYTNANSLKLNRRDSTDNSTILQGNPANITALRRAANGSGSGDAWTISMWVYASSGTGVETLLYYGGTDIVNDGNLTINQHGSGNISLIYGKGGAFTLLVGIGTFPINVWNHVFVTYDGGTTGSVVAESSNYQSRFTVSVNGVDAINAAQTLGGGYSGDIKPEQFKVGKYANILPQHFDGKLNQLAIWDSNQIANLSAVYNNRTTHDLRLLASPPAHYYEIENSVTSIPDLVGNANLTGYNFAEADLITDTP